MRLHRKHLEEAALLERRAQSDVMRRSTSYYMLQQ